MYLIKAGENLSKPHSSRDLTIFIISSIFLFEIIDAIVPDPKISLCIAASVVAIPADNPNGMKKLLARGISTLFINGKPAVINGLRKLRNPLS